MNLRNLFIFYAFISALGACKSEDDKGINPPNILFAISDDQSFAHTSFSGSEFINTPAFDRVAEEGVYFENCMAASPGCAPSRSAIVTGRHHWQNEQAGQHASSWLKKYVPFVDLLENSGYVTGRIGKGVQPFQYAMDDNDTLRRATDAAGIAHSDIRYEKGSPEDERPAERIDALNYAENFKYFLDSVRDDEPFFFWYGAYEPHRLFEQDSWKRNNKKLSESEVPGFLPDDIIVKGDMLDYAVEVEWFDLHLKRMLDYLEERGELDNTIVIVTSDNGMAFPRAKANCYEYGIHVPIAIRYPKAFPSGQRISSPVGFIDLAPTVLEMTNTSSEGMMAISGKSMVNILKGEATESQFAYSGRERHSSSRYRNWGYPQRSIRSEEYLLIWNLKPERWPAGSPVRIKPDSQGELLPFYGIDENGKHVSEWAFTDIDEAPTKSYLIENWDSEKLRPYFEMAHARRPEWEFYNTKEDPFCLRDLSEDDAHKVIIGEMKDTLMSELIATKDTRVVGPDKEVFDSYKRYFPIRDFPNPTTMELK